MSAPASATCARGSRTSSSPTCASRRGSPPTCTCRGSTRTRSAASPSSARSRWRPSTTWTLERKLTVYDKGFDHDSSSYGEYITRSGDICSPSIPNDEPLRIECAHFVDMHPQRGRRRARTARAACASCACWRRCSGRSTRVVEVSARARAAGGPARDGIVTALRPRTGRLACCSAPASTLPDDVEIGRPRRDPRGHGRRRRRDDPGRRDRRQAAGARRALDRLAVGAAAPRGSARARPSAPARSSSLARRSATARSSATRPRSASAPRSAPARSSAAARRSTTTSPIGARVRIQSNCYVTAFSAIEDDVFVGPGSHADQRRHDGPPRARPPAARARRCGAPAASAAARSWAGRRDRRGGVRRRRRGRHQGRAGARGRDRSPGARRARGAGRGPAGAMGSDRPTPPRPARRPHHVRARRGRDRARWGGHCG